MMLLAVRIARNIMKQCKWCGIAVVIVLLITVWSMAPALAMETAAKQAFMVDVTTHTVLLDKNSTERMHPSSMSKMMTLYVLFQRLKEGRVKLTDAFTVSEKAWRTQGSKTFVHVGDKVAVEDLIHGIIIQSGNDACIVVAEGLSGSEEALAEEMNRVAKAIGMNDSHFVNATGWPDENHLVTARDLAILGEHLITDFPEYYHYFSIREYTYNNIKQQNRNRLLTGDIGVDGIKTGHTEQAGYGITLSAEKSGRRLMLVINGLTSEDERAKEGDALLRWGFREFENKKLLSAGQKLDDAPVWFGAAKTVPIVAEKDRVVTLPVSASKNMSFTLKYTSPFPAPVAKGTHIADLLIAVPGGEPQVIPLVAGEEVDKLSGFSYLFAKLKYLLTGQL